VLGRLVIIAPDYDVTALSIVASAPLPLRGCLVVRLAQALIGVPSSGGFCGV